MDALNGFETTAYYALEAEACIDRIPFDFHDETSDPDDQESNDDRVDHVRMAKTTERNPNAAKGWIDREEMPLSYKIMAACYE
ncbi:hypothetical protein N7532_006493 [Penicillium argentinense]|uniref:Uncharacterized protein n=1 Tax=Penicillium argentinense TaxID=1131581 RepID=A0A9W9FFZ6_9EURO|nr:uncharacterized protein N7532_006493 [Penicillium argentinense]KAJ5099492.1 hypothetical protein N7532_006493 [Penicillium argentinense]